MWRMFAFQNQTLEDNAFHCRTRIKPKSTEFSEPDPYWCPSLGQLLLFTKYVAAWGEIFWGYWQQVSVFPSIQLKVTYLCLSKSWRRETSNLRKCTKRQTPLIPHKVIFQKPFRIIINFRTPKTCFTLGFGPKWIKLSLIFFWTFPFMQNKLSWHLHFCKELNFRALWIVQHLCRCSSRFEFDNSFIKRL